MAPLHPPLSGTKFTLNTWGVAGIFGGEEAISTLALIPLYQGRRWLGWYNSPGSLQVARHFGNVAHSHFWQRIFPHASISPAILFGFDGQTGPKYTAALSGTEMQTGHLGHLIVEGCKEIVEHTKIQGRRQTTPAYVALVNLDNVNYDHNVPSLSKINAFLALVPIFISIMTAVMCAFIHDWFSFCVILGGVLASGFASIAIGAGKLTLKSVTKPAPGSPAGDGMLVPVVCEDIVVVVKGAENAVNAITKGKFSLELGTNQFSEHAIGISSLFLVFEFLVQLFLIPQGTLFGQVMFVTSLCVSWLYNFHISSLRKETLQVNILLKKLGNPKIHKFFFGTRTMMAAFVALLVYDGIPDPSPDTIKKTLHALIPNNTIVWQRWGQKVAAQVRDQLGACE